MTRMHSTLASCVVLAACAMAAGQDCDSNGVPDTLEAFRIEPSFTSQFVPVDDAPSGIALADFDGDGDLDAALGFMANCCAYPGGTRVLMNDGVARRMVLGSVLNAGVGVHDVATADFNSDGRIDIASVDWIPHTVSIHLNAGRATFAPAIMIPIGERPVAIAVADMNRDGKPDLAVAHQFPSAISVLLNQGGGQFLLAHTYPYDKEDLRDIAAADLDGDGAAELVVTEAIENVISVWTNSGDGRFTRSAVIPAEEHLHRVIVTDLNGDGRPDLTASQVTTCCPEYGQVLVAMNDGHGSLGSPIAYWTGTASYGLAAGDLDHDGDPDLAVADFRNGIWWLLNRGDGTFVIRGPIPVAGQALDLTAGDLDGDGNADILAVLTSSDQVAVLTSRLESVSNDCNGNGQLDVCDIAAGVSADCNQNGIPDECDVVSTSQDCNENGIPDECELHDGSASDCNNNRVPDECDLANGTEQDCNNNNRPDSCDPDDNENGIPDDCESLSGILMVKADAEGDGSGRDWQNAVTDLQTALDLAGASDGGVTQIWVARGVYRPWRRTDGDDARSATFRLLNGVSLYGGFSGGEERLVERILTADNATVLDGDLMGNDNAGFASRTDNVYHVVTGSDLTAPSVLDGFVIRGGNASGPWNGSIHNSGGGLHIDQDGNLGYNPLIVSFCTFRENWAVARGGAAYLRITSAKLINCRFIANQAGGSGGAVAIEYGPPVLMGCVFGGNSTHTTGGAVYSYDAVPTLINCTVVGNTASEKYGGVHFVDGSAYVYNSILWGNADGNSETDTEQAQVWYDYCSDYVDHSCVMGWTGRFEGEGSFGTDPLLADLTGPDGVPATGDEDLHPRPGSPCIDAADNARVLMDYGDLDHDGETGGPTPFDLDGKARFVDDLGRPDTGAGVPPIVDMGAYESFLDCNNNGVADSYDIAAGTSHDCDLNGVPDECDPDCDGNGVPDACEPGVGDFRMLVFDLDPRIVDYSRNGAIDQPAFSRPPAMEIVIRWPGMCISPPSAVEGAHLTLYPNPEGPWADYSSGPFMPEPADNFGVELRALLLVTPEQAGAITFEFGADDLALLRIDGQEAYNPVWHMTEKVTWNLAPGSHELVFRTVEFLGGADMRLGWDADNKGGPRVCIPRSAISLVVDCNQNGVPDSCDLHNGTSQDCNQNGVPDECDISSGIEKDCNGNGIPDSCDIAVGPDLDCNQNGVPDVCDLAAGTSQDANGNGIPDECEQPPCAGTRELPAAYAPGVTMTVIITTTPGPVVAVHAVEDKPPTGWAVGAVNEGGVFDSATGKVKWGPFMDHAARTLTYEVTPPGTASGSQCFGPGVVSVDGLSTEICGTACVTLCFDHPADVNGDRRMVIDEVTAYASCWKQGCAWPLPPNPIPIGYVTRAGALWKNGETYCCDASLMPPRLWVNCPLRSPGNDSSRELLAVDGTPNAVRDVTPDGNGYLISIDVQPGAAAAYAIEESMPAGWSVSSVDEGGLFDPAARQVRWGPFFDGSARRLSYRAQPGAESSSSVLVGVLSVDGLDQPVTGSAIVVLGPDLDRDGDVDTSDLDTFTRCVSGPAVQPPSQDCMKADFDTDGDVDQSDFGILQRCFSGAGQPADPNCVK